MRRPPSLHRSITIAAGLLSVAGLLVAGCASPPPAPTVDAVLLGEQHDAPTHRQLQRDWVERLAAQGRLAALTLEMAEQGASTRGLPAGADEAQVRRALRWETGSWSWEVYAPVVMAAVRAGVPVLGANLPRARMRDAMGDAQIDALLPAPGLALQREAVRTGHCDLLPAAQIAPMTRIQIARDRAMAQTLANAARPGQTVLLVAGAGHVRADIGVPHHLPATWRVQPVVLPPHDTGKDYCADLKQQLPR